MRTRRIGSLEVSVAGLGCNNFGVRIDEPCARAVVDAALAAGVTHFDTADVYGDGRSEEFLGRALARRRDQAVITTKFGSASNTPPAGIRRGSAEWVRRSCRASLARLGTDWIDLYLLHQPDPETPIRETLEALAELQAAGKVRELGCSNASAAVLEEASAAAAELGIRGFVCVQNDYSLLNRTAEAELIPTCERYGTGFVPYQPLANGMLTGKYRRGAPAEATTRLAAWGEMFPDLLTDDSFATIERLQEYAAARGHTLHELALAWLASKPVIASVIAGATSPEQVSANAAAMTGWDMTPEEVAGIERLTDPSRAFTGYRP